MPRDGDTPQPESLTRWACVHTKPQAERWAADNLFRVGFDAYLPMTVVRRRDRNTGRYSMIQVPLFSRYMFFRHEIDSPWRGINGAPGVDRLLLNGTRPEYAPAGVIELLQQTEADRSNPAPAVTWKPGAACTISQGAFAGHEGAIIDVRGATARVGLFLFGQLRDVTVPLGNLLPRGA